MKVLLALPLLFLTACTSPEPEKISTGVVSGVAGGVVGGSGKTMEIDFSQVKLSASESRVPPISRPSKLEMNQSEGWLILPSGKQIELLDQHISYGYLGKGLYIKYKSLYTFPESTDFVTELNEVFSYWATQVDLDKNHQIYKINKISMDILLNNKVHDSDPSPAIRYHSQRSQVTNKWSKK